MYCKMIIIFVGYAITLNVIILQTAVVRTSPDGSEHVKTNDPEFTNIEIPVPIVLMHGLGCWGNFLFLDKRTILKHLNPKPYVKVIHTACIFPAEMTYSVTTQLRKQVNDICEIIKADEKLKHGYSIIGYSQGGVIMRGVVETCDGPSVFNLITIGAPHQGVYGVPLQSHFGVKIFKKRPRLNEIAKKKWMQEHSAVAGYWHNPFDEEEYKKFNVFLPDINNENEVKVEYKERFSQLNLLVLVIFKKDTFIVPYQSGAFGYFKSGDEKGTILSMEETELYKQDRIGLRTLDEKHKVVIIEKDSEHAFYNSTWFKETILMPFLTLKMKSIPCSSQPDTNILQAGSTSYSTNFGSCFRLKESSETSDKTVCSASESSPRRKRRWLHRSLFFSCKLLRICTK